MFCKEQYFQFPLHIGIVSLNDANDTDDDDGDLVTFDGNITFHWIGEDSEAWWQKRGDTLAQ